MSKPVITFFTRQDCRLCDSALFALRRALTDVEHELIEVDIDRQPEYLDAYDHHVPVIWLNGTEICRHRLDAARLLSAIREQS